MSSSPRAFNVPTVIVVVTAIFVLVHVVRLALPPQGDMEVMLRFAFFPVRYVLAPGAGLPGGTGAKIWTFVSYMFLHADMTHLLVNSLWMLVFGSVVARRLGTTRFLLFSLLCGVGGIALHLVARWGDPVPVIGASAAISGQMAGAVRFMFAPGGVLGGIGGAVDPRLSAPAPLMAVFRNKTAMIFLAVWFALNLMTGLGGVSLNGEQVQVAWEAHLGGFLTGLLAFGLFDRRRVSHHTS